MLIDVRLVHVVQDRESGAFVDVNMTFVNSLRAAAQVDTAELARETMRNALYDGVLECPGGFDVISLYLPVDDDHRF